jgi:hypothetical protein
MCGFVISFDDKRFKYTIVDNDEQRLISLIYDNKKYELHHNKQVNWFRINIWENNSFKDLPLNANTMKLLPSDVKVM